MHMVNLALNRPALQSSASRFSESEKPEEAAGCANNGKLAVDYGCHTSDEDRPWWQVDLGEDTVIESVVIHNRQQCAYRLRYFSLHASLNGEQWQRFYKRTDPHVFGTTPEDIFVVAPEKTVIARFVRLQLDYRETLHFRECEVFGRPPTRADRAQVAAQNDLAAREKALLAGRSGQIVKIGKHSIFVDEHRYGSKVTSALLQGRYEGEEREFTEKMLLPPDRVLELGTAVGVISMVAADCTSPEQVRTFDGNPYIIADAKRNYAFNQIEGITATAGILRNRRMMDPAEATVKFTVLQDFWASRLGVSASASGVVDVVDVPVFCLEDEIASHRANVLIIDIEGGEIDLMNGADLSGIRLIIMETHYWAVGVEATDAMIRHLVYLGFNINLSHSRYGVVVMTRNPGK